MRNRELAKQRQLEKKLEKQKLADHEESQATISEQNQTENPTPPPNPTVSKNLHKKSAIFF